MCKPFEGDFIFFCFVLRLSSLSQMLFISLFVFPKISHSACHGFFKRKIWQWLRELSLRLKFIITHILFVTFLSNLQVIVSVGAKPALGPFDRLDTRKWWRFFGDNGKIFAYMFLSHIDYFTNNASVYLVHICMTCCQLVLNWYSK